MDDCKLNVREIVEKVNINWKCIYNFTQKIAHEKGLFQMDAAFAHDETKATTNRQFRELFSAVYSQLTEFLASICDNG